MKSYIFYFIGHICIPPIRPKSQDENYNLNLQVQKGNSLRQRNLSAAPFDTKTSFIEQIEQYANATETLKNQTLNTATETEPHSTQPKINDSLGLNTEEILNIAHDLRTENIASMQDLSMQLSDNLKL